MTKPRVYIETTIPSYLTAQPTADPVRALNQLLTREWWDIRRHDFDICVAQPVLDECGEGDPTAARLRLDISCYAAVLDLTLEALELAEEIVATGALPPNAATDATHIAIAATNGVQYLLTWNCKHIANPALWPTLGRLCDRRWLKLPAIVTPAQFLSSAAMNDPIVEGINDPIVEEIHRYREAYAARFNYDLKAMFEDMRARQEASGRTVVSYPPGLIEAETLAPTDAADPPRQAAA